MAACHRLSLQAVSFWA